MKQKIMKVGNSLGVTVPSSFVKSMGIIAGSQVKVRIIPEKGKIVYYFDGICQLPLSEILLKK
jgi:antitoxin component of MazEF toxin-antitoxin module